MSEMAGGKKKAPREDPKGLHLLEEGHFSFSSFDGTGGDLGMKEVGFLKSGVENLSFGIGHIMISAVSGWLFFVGIRNPPFAVNSDR